MYSKYGAVAPGFFKTFVQQPRICTRLSDGELRETQTAAYSSNLYSFMQVSPCLRIRTDRRTRSGEQNCKQAGNTDKQGGNILVQTICGDRKALEKKKDTRISSEKERHTAQTAAGMPDAAMQGGLVNMKEMDIREADINTLADILEIKIDSNLDSTEKKREFIRQIKNPYLYRQGEYVVKLSFADTDATLTDRLKEYIEHMAAAGL